MFARDDLPLKSPNPDDRHLRNIEGTMPPDVLTKGIFRKVLEAPSHVILNHANCWTETNPTLAPNGDRANNQNQQQESYKVQEIEDGTESQDGVDKGMTAVSLTLRLNVNKFTTLTYYKPRLATPGGQPNSQQ